VFGASAQLWLNMQASHDLSVAYIAKKAEIAQIRELEPA
jgi:plasmid maintenance system antidote protein VapI